MTKKINMVIEKMKKDNRVKSYIFNNINQYRELEIWLKPFQLNGFFDGSDIPEENEGKWSQILFLKALANQENKTEETKEIILKIIENIFKLEERSSRVDLELIEILFKLNQEKIEEKHLKLILGNLDKIDKKSWFYNLIIEKLIKELDKIETIKEKLLLLNKVIELDFSREESKFVLEKFKLKKIIDDDSKKIVKELKLEGLNLLIGNLNLFMRESNQEISLLTIPSIKPHSQNWNDREESIFVKFIRIYLENLKVEELKEAVKVLLEEEKSIFKRLALYGVNLNYLELKNIFWNFFKEMKVEPHKIKLELYRVFEKNSKDFKENELDFIINWVKNIKYNDLEKEDNREQIEAYRRKEWLISLKELKNEKIEDYHNKLNKIDNFLIKHPGFSSWTESGWVEKSLLGDKEQFFTLKIEEALETLNRVKEDNKELKTPIYYRRLEEDLFSYIKRHPQESSKKINLFRELDIKYKSSLLRGLGDSWREKKELEWDNILEFMIRELDELKEKGLRINNDDVKQYKRSMASLILEGVQNDENAFVTELLSKAKKILFLLLEDKELEDKGSIARDKKEIDYIMLFLNSYHGKVLSALVNYSLREVRVKKCKWDNEIKGFFYDEIKKNDEYKKFIFITLAYYLSNFLYLDKEWILNNFENIFLEKEEFNEVSVYSYFKTLRRNNLCIYEKFKENRHYEKLKDKSYYNKVLEEILNNYIWGYDEKTIFRVIEIASEKTIEKLGFYLSGMERDIPEEIESRLKNLLKSILNKLKSEEREEEMGNFSEWIVFFNEDNLNELKEEIELIYENINKDYWNRIELDLLIEISKKSLLIASEIFMILLKKDNFEIYGKPKIKNFVKTLYKEKETKENARQIIRLFNDKEQYFLNDILN